MSGDRLRTSNRVIMIDLAGDTARTLLVHGYSGAFDEVSAEVTRFLRHRRRLSPPLYGRWEHEGVDVDSGADDDLEPLDEETLATLQQRGYLTALSEDEEAEQFAAIVKGLHTRASKNLHFVIMPTYDCNLRCPYCFQDEMRREGSCGSLQAMSSDTADRIFMAMSDLEEQLGAPKERPRTYTLFGGEPLLASNRATVAHILDCAQAVGPFQMSAVTNGTDLHHYRDMLGPSKIASLQITLDGDVATHNSLRVYPDGAGSFSRIADNVSLALQCEAAVSIRVNVSRDTLPSLAGLVERARTRGWTAQPRFRIYAAPIQPTHGFPDGGRLFNRWQLEQSLAEAAESWPSIAMVEGPTHGLEQSLMELFQSPDEDPIRMYKPSFCGAHAGMYVFDPFGDIYSCWERTGDPGIRTGHVDSTGRAVLEQGVWENWQGRNVLRSTSCVRCPYALYCGGGCAVAAEEGSIAKTGATRGLVQLGVSGSARQNARYPNHCDGFAARFRRAVGQAYRKIQIQHEEHTR